MYPRAEASSGTFEGVPGRLPLMVLLGAPATAPLAAAAAATTPLAAAAVVRLRAPGALPRTPGSTAPATLVARGERH